MARHLRQGQSSSGDRGLCLKIHHWGIKYFGDGLYGIICQDDCAAADLISRDQEALQKRLKVLEDKIISNFGFNRRLRKGRKH